MNSLLLLAAATDPYTTPTSTPPTPVQPDVQPIVSLPAGVLPTSTELPTLFIAGSVIMTRPASGTIVRLAQEFPTARSMNKALSVTEVSPLRDMPAPKSADPIASCA